MSEDQPVRFYAVTYGAYDDYCEFYILATSPDNAIRQLLRSERPFYNVIGSVWEADFDKNGVIGRTDELAQYELPGKNGYLWAKTGNSEIDDIDAKYGIIRCLLCGGSATDKEITDNIPFLNTDNKCAECAIFKTFKT